MDATLPPRPAALSSVAIAALAIGVCALLLPLAGFTLFCLGCSRRVAAVSDAPTTAAAASQAPWPAKCQIHVCAGEGVPPAAGQKNPWSF